MDRIGLDHLTVLEAPPLEMLAIAAELGYSTLTLRLRRPRADSPAYRIDPALMTQMKRAMSDTGVSVHTVEVLIIGPGFEVPRYQGLADTCAELGVKVLLTICMHEDLERGAEDLATLADIAAERGMSVGLEFSMLDRLQGIDRALAVVDRSGRPNAGLLIDTLHLFRTGSGPAEVAKLRDRILYVQLADGPLAAPADQAAEATYDRTLLGEGEFPLSELLKALGPDIPRGIEIPMNRLRDRGVAPLERARLARDAYRRLAALSRS